MGMLGKVVMNMLRSINRLLFASIVLASANCGKGFRGSNEVIIVYEIELNVV